MKLENEGDISGILHFGKEHYFVGADTDFDLQTQARNHQKIELVKPSDGITLSQLIDAASGDFNFSIGDVVEYRDVSMTWKVGMIDDITDVDGSKVYGIDNMDRIARDDVRAPGMGLKSIFGKRPWLWQQMTLLQLERRLRFHRSHEHDFQEIDYCVFASNRYDAWLNSSTNQDFLLWHNQQSQDSQKLLKDHIMLPFKQMQNIVHDTVEWNFNDPEISLYTYLSVLGSSFFICLTTFLVQAFSPVLLIYSTMRLFDGSPNPRFEVDEEGDALSGLFIPSTSFDQFCLSGEDFPGRVEGKILIMFVVLLYLITVVPDTLLDAYKLVVGSPQTYWKILSLRRILWDKHEDRPMQQIGYKIDGIMNVGFVAFLYSAMLFILFNTFTVLDIILNSLAIAFIHRIDEQIAKAGWWDGSRRWLKAGVIELVIQIHLEQVILSSPSSICKEYGIDENEFILAVGNFVSMKKLSLAREDDVNDLYMTFKERFYKQVGEDKHITRFSYFSKLFAFLGFQQSSLFERHNAFRTWSRWCAILSLPHVPTEEEVAKAAQLKTPLVLKRYVSEKSQILSNVVSVASGYDIMNSIVQAWKYGRVSSLRLRVVLSFFEWMFYGIIVLFPFLTTAWLLLFPFCY